MRMRIRATASSLIMLGALADASLARPDRLALVDLALFATALASALLFLAIAAPTRPRLALAGGVAVVSAVAAVVDVARGVGPFETLVAAADVVMRLALVGALGMILAQRSPAAA